MAESEHMPQLPLPIYGKIARFLDVKMHRQRRLKSKECKSLGDIMNFCIAGGKEVADVVRFAYLRKNKEYLRKAILSKSSFEGPHDAIVRRKAWMDINPEWRDICTNSTVRYCSNLRRHTSIEGTRYEIELTPSGSLAYKEYTKERGKRKYSIIIDGLMYINKEYACGTSGSDATIYNERIEHSRVNLSFLNDSYFLFSDPVAAIRFGLVDALRNMIEKKFICPNDSFQYLWDNMTCENATKLPLLHHAVSSGSYDCFKYLLDLPNIDCSTVFKDEHDRTTNHLASCLGISGRLPFVKALLEHPSCPDVNIRLHDGYTALHLLCRLDEEYSSIFNFNNEDVAMLRCLLSHGADPTMITFGAKLAVDKIRAFKQAYLDDGYLAEASEYHDHGDFDVAIYDEMIDLLERYDPYMGYDKGLKRKEDQPAITDFFKTAKRPRTS